jgi:hypothetical protein
VRGGGAVLGHGMGVVEQHKARVGQGREGGFGFGQVVRFAHLPVGVVHAVQVEEVDLPAAGAHPVGQERSRVAAGILHAPRVGRRDLPANGEGFGI